jgi:hypothetical protein
MKYPWWVYGQHGPLCDDPYWDAILRRKYESAFRMTAGLLAAWLCLLAACWWLFAKVLAGCAGRLPS